MKRIIRISLVAVLLLSATQIFAQGKFKFGHIDSNQLLSIMPERAEAQKAIEEHAKDLETQMQEMQMEFERKYQDLVTKQDSLSEFLKNTKTAELEDLQQRIQTYRQTAQQELQTKEAELLQPIIEKAKKAIEEVGKENGYTYVYDISLGVILYFSDESEDILPIVKQKLGIE